MTARDDYPTLVDFCPHVLDEIDRLREDCITWEATVDRLNRLWDEARLECEQLNNLKQSDDAAYARVCAKLAVSRIGRTA